jgi:hypothetical protein
MKDTMNKIVAYCKEREEDSQQQETCIGSTENGSLTPESMK